MWLEWEPAAMVVFILVGAVIALRPVAARWADVVGAFARELAIMFTLYAVWRLAAQLSLMQVDGAVWRGRWLWDVQRALHLPSEVSVQHLVLPHPLLVWAGYRAASTVDFVTSNMRAAPFDIYLAGALMESNYPLGPLAGTAFNLSTMSYRGTLDMGLVSDPAAIEEPALLAKCIERGFRELLAASGV